MQLSTGPYTVAGNGKTTARPRTRMIYWRSLELGKSLPTMFLSSGSGHHPSSQVSIIIASSWKRWSHSREMPQFIYARQASNQSPMLRKADERMERRRRESLGGCAPILRKIPDLVDRKSAGAAQLSQGTCPKKTDHQNQIHENAKILVTQNTKTKTLWWQCFKSALI